MRCFVLVDSLHDGDWFLNTFENAEQACKYAEDEWGKMHSDDKARRSAYYVAEASIEDGKIVKTHKIVKTIKSWR